MRAIVCGGRDYSDEFFLFSILNTLRTELPITHIIEGGARGADSLARKWARTNSVTFDTVHADWTQFGKRAGYIRNKHMRDHFNPDVVIAFPGGIGTQMMVNLAKEKNITVIDYR